MKGVVWFSLSLVFGTGTAYGATTPGIAWDCSEAFEHFVIYSAHTEQNKMADGPEHSLHRNGTLGTIVTCQIGSRNLSLVRTFINQPRPKGGVCAGLAWAGVGAGPQHAFFVGASPHTPGVYFAR